MLERRLMKMPGGVADLTLEFLNEATQAWAGIEYNRRPHRETGSSPVERFGHSPDVLRAIYKGRRPGATKGEPDRAFELRAKGLKVAEIAQGMATRNRHADWKTARRNVNIV
jgi:hypothetical protein